MSYIQEGPALPISPCQLALHSTQSSIPLEGSADQPVVPNITFL